MLGNLGLSWLNDFILLVATTYRTFIVNLVKTANSLNDFNVDEILLCLMFFDVNKSLLLRYCCMFDIFILSCSNIDSFFSLLKNVVLQNCTQLCITVIA